MQPWTRFNEAPIHESGKSMALTAANSTESGFNEAPIHESGKCSEPKTIRLCRRPLQ